MAQINKKTLEYLAELGKIKIEENNEEKLIADLEKILAYFEELKSADTENVELLAGGTTQTNVFREDNEEETRDEIRGIRVAREKLTRAFPEEEKGFLRVPAVFE